MQWKHVIRGIHRSKYVFVAWCQVERVKINLIYLDLFITIFLKAPRPIPSNSFSHLYVKCFKIVCTIFSLLMLDTTDWMFDCISCSSLYVLPDFLFWTSWDQRGKYACLNNAGCRINNVIWSVTWCSARCTPPPALLYFLQAKLFCVCFVAVLINPGRA